MTDLIDALRQIATNSALSARDMAVLARSVLNSNGIPLTPKEEITKEDLDMIANLPEMDYSNPDGPVAEILLPNNHKSVAPKGSEFRRLAKAKCAAIAAIQIDDDALVIPQVAGAVVAAWVHV